MSTTTNGAARPAIVGTVAWKELRELFRDLRSVALNILVPLILFPALFLVLDENVAVQRSIRERERSVAVAPGVALSRAERAVLESYTLLPGVGVEAVAGGRVVVAIDTAGRIVYNERSETSTAVAARLAGELTAVSDGADSAASLVRTAPVLVGIHGDASPAVLGGATLISLLLLLAALISPLPAALDLGAGEKQRQSLEFLLVTTGRRGSLFLGKLVAVYVAGLAGVGSFAGGVLLAARLVPDLFAGSVVWGTLTPGGVMTLITASLLLTALLCAIELAISVFARSPREAQSLFLPLLLLVSGAAYVTVLSDVWYLPDWVAGIPILNLAVLIKAAMLTAPPFLAPVVVGVENIALFMVLFIAGRSLLRSEWVIQRS